MATVAAVASGVATATESPTDVEPALTTGSAAVGSLLALVAVAAAVHAAGPLSRPPTRRTVQVSALAGATPWLLRYVSPQPSGGRYLAIFAFTVLLVVSVVALAGPRAESRRHRYGHAAVAAIVAVTLPAMYLPLALLAIVLQIGEPFTELAANTPINTADEDVVLIALTIPIGLVLARILRDFTLDESAGAPGGKSGRQ
ncbi:hypothetical protein [Actinoplanes aureus]|uniref:Uncharacterized protein n=1 Tax=Actinoplanes aureus TaxID=2792083 RepID=A0A931G2G4_9ACTN|nr:hypothetical protein [Actinoplanes aureus]MBG0569023.1 hypothetical protein [Actinoplanes aureus]